MYFLLQSLRSTTNSGKEGLSETKQNNKYSSVATTPMNLKGIGKEKAQV
jgi:hypothetical protein